MFKKTGGSIPYWVNPESPQQMLHLFTENFVKIHSLLDRTGWFGGREKCHLVGAGILQLTHELVGSDLEGRREVFY